MLSSLSEIWLGKEHGPDLDAARARGRKGGRPEALDSEKRKLLIDLYEQKKNTG